MDRSRQEKSAVQTSALTDEVRRELLDARETAWRSFFQKDLAVVERILAPELIAIQENSEHWVNRTRMIAMAKAMNEQGVHLLRLEFPRTEIQLFGDTAILYYTYIFENGSMSVGISTTVHFRMQTANGPESATHCLRQAARRLDEPTRSPCSFSESG